MCCTCDGDRRRAALVVGCVSVVVLTLTASLTVVAIMWNDQLQTFLNSAVSEADVEMERIPLHTEFQPTKQPEVSVHVEAFNDPSYKDAEETSGLFQQGQSDPNKPIIRADVGKSRPARSRNEQQNRAAALGHSTDYQERRQDSATKRQRAAPPAAVKSPPVQGDDRAAQVAPPAAAVSTLRVSLSHLFILQPQRGTLYALLFLQLVFLTLTFLLLYGIHYSICRFVYVWLVASALGLAVTTAAVLLSAHTALSTASLLGGCVAAAYLGATAVMWAGWALVMSYYKQLTVHRTESLFKPHFSEWQTDDDAQAIYVAAKR